MNLWAEKFDRELASIFEVQDEVVRAVAASTQLRLIIREGESVDRAMDLDCWALTARAWKEFYGFTEESLRSAEEIGRQLTARFPMWPKGHVVLATSLYHQVIMGFREATPSLRAEMTEIGRRGLQLGLDDDAALVVLAMILMEFDRELPEAMSLLKRALDVNPNYAVAYGILGDVHLLLGHTDEAIRFSEMAIRLNPRDPSIFFRYATLAGASFVQQEHQQTVHWSNQTVALKPDYWLGYALAAASFALNNDTEGAKRSGAALKRCWPTVRVSTMKTSTTILPEASWSRFAEGLIAAGIPA